MSSNATSLDALDDALLLQIFSNVARGGGGDDLAEPQRRRADEAAEKLSEAWHPAHLARIARFSGLVDAQCWRAAAERHFPVVALALADARGNNATPAEWKAAYKLLTLVPWTAMCSDAEAQDVVAAMRSNRRPHIRKLAGIWQSVPRAGTTRAPRVQELTFCGEADVFEGLAADDALDFGIARFLWRGFCPRFGATALHTELFGVHAGAGAAGAAPAPCRFCDGATAQLPAVRCSIEFENQVRARAEDAFKDYDEEAVDCTVTHNNDLCVRTCALGHIFATWTASLIPLDGEDEELHEELDEELDDEELYDSEDTDGWDM